MASFAENWRKYWVEWLAVALFAMGVFLFVNSDSIGRSSPQDMSGVAALFYSMFVGAIGLSLFLVRPILLLGPNCPSWEIVAVGAILLPWFDNICRAANPGDIHSGWLDGCRFVAPQVGIVLVALGIVLIARKLQILGRL